MPRANKADDAAYQKRRLSDPVERAKHKARCDRNRIENSRFRKGILAQFGCSLCDVIDPDLIDWHHVNPEEKLFDIKGALDRNHALWWDEVLKCIPVCCNCHRKIHKNKLCLINPIEYKQQQVTASTSVRTCTCPQ